MSYIHPNVIIFTRETLCTLLKDVNPVVYASGSITPTTKRFLGAISLLVLGGDRSKAIETIRVCVKEKCIPAIVFVAGLYEYCGEYEEAIKVLEKVSSGKNREWIRLKIEEIDEMISCESE